MLLYICTKYEVWRFTRIVGYGQLFGENLNDVINRLIYMKFKYTSTYDGMSKQHTEFNFDPT